MDPIRKIIIVYEMKALCSYLWINKGAEWFLFEFANGGDVYPDLQENFDSIEISYSDLPESLRMTLETDGFDEKIKAIYSL